MKYRSDIDVLRTFAVFPVILFHLGYSHRGYLGVDVFFVISGFLITGIIFKEINAGNFSFLNFYERRIRRIIPLVLSIITFSFPFFYFIMLPDDLENFAQSIVATNLFSNNILLEITTGNYWDVVNDYKPLMHTWSLGIEEQFYFIYPFLFILFKSKKKLLIILSILSVISLILFFSSFPDSYKFYYLPFRFFELAFGGIIFLISKNININYNYSFVLVPLLIFLLFVNYIEINNNLLIPITIFITSAIILTDYKKNSFLIKIFENKLLVFLGKISFGLYIWHQIIISFYRYGFDHEINDLSTSLSLIILTVIFSVLTYYLVERPFRNSKKYTFKTVLIFLSILFFSTSTFSLWIYSKGGVVRDVPELSILKDNDNFKLHQKYNDNVRALHSSIEFQDKTKSNVLVIGNSFARDWINVLKEINDFNTLEIVYVEKDESLKTSSGKKLLDDSNIIFVSEMSKLSLKNLNIPEHKTFCAGTKNFGENNGIFYNYTGPNYYNQKTRIDEKSIKLNNKLLDEWGVNYINILGYVIKNDKVPVFTNDSLFISQDTRHFTLGGAKYFAQLMEKDISLILKNNL
jgi:peptidoglycan/LPS O-acetylase OafA/YrhL